MRICIIASAVFLGKRRILQDGPLSSLLLPSTTATWEAACGMTDRTAACLYMARRSGVHVVSFSDNARLCFSELRSSEVYFPQGHNLLKAREIDDDAGTTTNGRNDLEPVGSRLMCAHEHIHLLPLHVSLRSLGLWDVLQSASFIYRGATLCGYSLPNRFRSMSLYMAAPYSADAIAFMSLPWDDDAEISFSISILATSPISSFPSSPEHHMLHSATTFTQLSNTFTQLSNTHTHTHTHTTHTSFTTSE